MEPNMWFIRLRWVVSALQFISLIPGVMLGLVNAENLGSYLLVLSILPLFNAGLVVLTKARFPRSRRSTEGMVLGCLAVDLLQLSILLGMTGGWANPFCTLIFLYASLAAVVLRGWALYAYGSLLMVIIAALQLWARGPTPLRQLEAWTVPVIDCILSALVCIALMLITHVTMRGLHKRQKTLNQLRDQGVRMDRLRAIGALSGGVCHQLASPLNSIRLRIDRLKRLIGHDEALSGDIESIRTSLSKAEIALRRLADVKVNPKEISTEPFDLVELLKQCGRSWLEAQPEGRVQVRYKLPPRAEARIPVSSFAQVILDLLDNARDASPIGATIELGLKKKESGYELWVQDEGAGFPEQVLHFLGEPFNTQKDDGNGLGLYHAQLVSQLVGGQLSVQNLENKGACVALMLPAPT